MKYWWHSCGGVGVRVEESVKQSAPLSKHDVINNHLFPSSSSRLINELTVTHVNIYSWRLFKKNNATFFFYLRTFVKKKKCYIILF